MHATVEQLLTLRDGSAAPDLARHVAGCAACTRELQRLRELRAALCALPDVPPGDDAWAGVLARTSRPRRWPHAMAAVALIVLATTVALLRPAALPDAPVVARGAAPGPFVARSAQLEQTLRALSSRPRVVDARTAAAIAALESQIAVLDYGLSHGAGGRLPPGDAERLWRDRVGLMESLLSLHYAQVQQVRY